MAVENIKEKEQKVKEIWLNFRDDLSLKEIYMSYLGDYFYNKVWHKNHPDWFNFIRWVGIWKRVEEREKLHREAEEITDEEILEVQNKNRKRAILMLRDTLTKYEKNPRFFKNIDVDAIASLYRIVQSAEEASRRTEISKKKLGLEAAKVFLLPYQRLPLEDLIKLRDAFNASINRILQLKSGREQGSGPVAVSSR